MKHVVSAQAECPTRVLGRPRPAARVAAEAAFDSGAAGTAPRACRTVRVADDPSIVARFVQAYDDLLEVPPQFRQLLGKLVQRRVGRRAGFNRCVAVSALSRCPPLAQV